MMKKWIGFLAVAIAAVSCQDNDSLPVAEFTGNEMVFALDQASDFIVNGTATFKEKVDGSTLVIIALHGTEGEAKLPAHLHLGDIKTPAADIAVLLNPVLATSGISETSVTKLADDTQVAYKELIQLEASIKIHLSDVGPERDIILAGGNVGALATKTVPGGRVGMAICKSE